MYVPSGHQHEMEKGSGVSSSGGSQGSEVLHSMLATAIPEQQKQIIGEFLYPLIKKLKVQCTILFHFWYFRPGF